MIYNTKLRNSVLRKALNSKYGAKNVSVRGDTGTAHGWVRIGLIVDNYHTNSHTKHNIYGTCIECANYKTLLRAELMEYSISEMAKHDLGFYSYTDDMGYNNYEVLIDITFRNDL